MGLRITEKMPKHPRGGTMFLLNTSTFNRGDHADGHQGQNIADGYMWTEILHQSDLITSKENHLDYRHYYISTSLGDGRRRRTSSKFRHSEPKLMTISLLFEPQIREQMLVHDLHVLTLKLHSNFSLLKKKTKT